MTQLAQQWFQAVTAASADAVACRDDLKARMVENPDLFKNFSTRDIADTLQMIEDAPADDAVLMPLYAAYDAKSNHAFRAWDFSARIELMKSLASAGIENSADRLSALSQANILHGQIFGFTPERIETYTKEPVAHENGFVTLSSGYHDTQAQAVYLNIWEPTEPGSLVPSFHRGATPALALVLHEGRHTFQGELGSASASLPDDFADVATIMRINMKPGFYLTGTNDRNHLNPCEKDAYDFQKGVETFLDRSPAERVSFIRSTEMRRDYHAAIAGSPMSVVRQDAALVPSMQIPVLAA